MQVSRAWKEAVESQVTGLCKRGTLMLTQDDRPLPRNLAARFPGLRSLDLGERKHYFPHQQDYFANQKEVNETILSLPHLEVLLGYSGIAGLRQMDSPKQLKQRADLAARLTRLSVRPDITTLDREEVGIPMLAEEWRGLKSFKLCGSRISLDTNNFKPILVSLEHLDVHSWQEEYSQALLASEEAGRLKSLVLWIDADLGYPSQFDIVHFFNTLARLQDLESLILGGSFIHDEGITALNMLTKLTALTFEEGYLSSNGLSQLTALSGIHNLGLRSSALLQNLQEWPIGLQHVFGNFCNLLHLDISHCRQIEADAILGRLTTLTSLCANGCSKLGSLAPLQALTRLQSLQLSDTVGYSIEELTGFQSLTSLDISRGALLSRTVRQTPRAQDLEDVDLVLLENLASLCYLNLQGHLQITASGLDHLAGLESLVFLNIKDCDSVWWRAPLAFPHRDSTVLQNLLGRSKNLLHVWAYLRDDQPPIPWPSPSEARRLLQPPQASE